MPRPPFPGPGATFVNKVSSVLGAAAVIAIAIVFIVQFRPATGAQSASGPTCALEINGNCISSQDFWATYRFVAPRNTDAARLKPFHLRERTAEGLIERWLLVQDAKRLGLTVSDEDLNAELRSGRVHVSLPADKAEELAYYLGGEGIGRQLLAQGVRLVYVKDRKTKKFDLKQYEKETRTVSQMSPTDFREFQKKELVASRMRDLVKSRVRVSEAEAFDQFSYERSTATVDYVKLERGFYADVVLDRSDKAIESWADKHKDEIDKVWEARKPQLGDECRQLRSITARMDPEASDPDAAKAKAKATIAQAQERLKKGDEFADVARDLSEDGAAIRGGELGCLPRGKLPKPVEEAALALSAGKVSDPIETETGVVLLKVDTVAKGADAEKLARREIARDLYVAQESERMAAEAAKQILAAVKGGKSVEDAVKAHLDELPKPKADKKGEKKDDKKDAPAGREPVTAANHPKRPSASTTLPFNLTGTPIQDVKQGTDAARIAFDLAKPGDAPNDVIPLEAGYAVMALKEKAPASKESWDKERERYVSSLRNTKQNEALAAYVKQLRSKLATEIKQNPAVVNEPKEDKSKGGGEAPPPIEDLGDE
jgi:peptidyl-prolyl cis-trans isomerase D